MQGDRARSALSSTRFADVRWVDETGSTNQDLLVLAAQGAPEGVVLVADHQLAGRGRLDRTWQAPPDSSLLMSILFRPAMAISDAHLLTTAVALSAAEACETVTGVVPSLKWPNDLVLVGTGGEPDRKLGGILAESTVEGSELRALVVGLGLNVNWPDPLPAELSEIAVALNTASGGHVDREALLIALLQRLDAIYADITGPPVERRAALMADAERRSATIGRQVRVQLDGGSFEGTATGLTPNGELLVEVVGPDGAVEQREVVAGDVILLRATD